MPHTSDRSSAPSARAAAPLGPGRPRLVVAVDGPSGAGKSTVSGELAQKLGSRYLDTGAMYRAVTLKALEEGRDLNDPDAIAGVLDGLCVEPGLDPVRPTIRLNGRDVSGEVRSATVTRAVSAVSAVPAVRAALVRVQRAAIEEASAIVVEGRDIGTVVVPDATVKVFLTAAPDARAERRNLELRSRSGDASLRGTAADLARRDALDSGRPISPLARADDAVEIDTTAMTAVEAVDTIMKLVRDRIADAADR